MSKPTAADRLEQIREEISEGMLTPPFISKMEVVLSLLDALEAELEQVKAILAEHKNRENEPLQGSNKE